MGKNLTVVTLTGQGTYNIPAGVKVINVYGVPRQDFQRVGVGDGGAPNTFAIYNDGSLSVVGARSFANNIQCNPVAPLVSQSFPYPSMAPRIASISSFNKHVLAQDASGRIYGWGENQSGELGNNQILGPGLMVSYPVLVASGLTFKRISAGGGFSAGLRADGSVYTWGNNGNGRLGDGTVANKSSPVQVLGGHSFTQVAAGTNFAIALKANGQAWTWGQNTSGQLGDGTNVAKSSPVQVVGGLSFVEVAAGDFNCIGRLANGNVYVWGDNFYGQIGNNNGAVSSYSSPIQVVGGLSFSKIYGASAACFALTAAGVAYAWGFNGSGFLGDNSVAAARSSPVLVAGGKSFYQLANAGSSLSHMVGWGRDGNIYAWGNNGAGQLGDGTTVPKSSPVLTYFGNRFTPIGQNVLLNVYRPSSSSVTYNLNDPDVFNDLMNQYAGILYDSLVLEFQA